MDITVKYIFSFLLALVVGYLLIPPIIYVCQVGNFMDEPDFRKKHTNAIPTLGGISIVASLMSATILLTDYSADLIIWIFSCCVLLVTGIKDDLVRIPAYKRLIVQLLSGVILIIPFWGGLKIENFHYFLGLTTIPIEVSVIFTLFVTVLLINSYNFIDGIDTILGKLTATNAILLFVFMLLAEKPNEAIIAIALLGAIVAFLKFNWTPASIFMGDSGSMVIGFTMAFFVIKLTSIESIPVLQGLNPALFAILLNALIMFDTLRLIIIRSLKRKSPFSPDRRHFHHILVDRNLNHQQASNKMLLYHLLLIICGVTLNLIGLEIHLVLVSVFFLFLGFARYEKYLLKQYRKSKIIAFKSKHERVA